VSHPVYWTSGPNPYKTSAEHFAKVDIRTLGGGPDA